MTQPYTKIVDFNLYNIDNDQFNRILMRVTTSIVNAYFKQKLSIEDIYHHVNFRDGNKTNLHVQNLILVH